MSGLISSPPAPVSPEGSIVGADGWFPDVDVSAIRAAIRMGEGVVTHDRLVAAIEGAILTALRALADWRALHASAGVAELADVPDDDPILERPIMINGRPRAVLIWERIIRFYAAAEVADLHRDLTATNEAAVRNEEERLTADDYRRLAYAAVADMRSIGATAPVQRNQVDLI